MPRIIENPFSSQDLKTFQKVRKSLCLNGVTENLELPLQKNLLKTILKKQRYQKVFKKLQITRNQLLKDGICGKKVEVQPRALSFFSRRLTTDDADRYRQVFLKNKTIQEAYLLSLPESPPWGLFKAVGCLRHLQTLAMWLFTSDFPKFPKVLEYLSNLRNLCIIFKKSDQEEMRNKKTIEGTFAQFCSHLTSKESLHNLQLDIQIHDFVTEESRTNLLSTIGDLNLKFFKIVFQTCGQAYFSPLRVRKFLQQVELLILMENPFGGQSFPENKALILVGIHIPNFKETLLECSSLKNLTFNPLLAKDNLPENLGLAKNITELTIQVPYKRDKPSALPQLGSLLSEASRLETFTFTFFEFNQDDLQYSHSHPRIKGTLFEIASSDAPLWSSPMVFKDLYSQIARLQSLRVLNFTADYMEDVMLWETAFQRLVNLQELFIQIRSVGPNDSDFPIESFDSLQSLEILNLDSPVLEKHDVLSRFPKMSVLKSVCITAGFLTQKLNMLEYRNKFDL